jgi:hypothetical protein
MEIGFDAHVDTHIIGMVGLKAVSYNFLSCKAVHAVDDTVWGGIDMNDEKLSKIIAETLSTLEGEDHLVIINPSAEFLADRIVADAQFVIPHTGLTQEELFGVRSLILHAIANKGFFDWEMPTLTGFTAEEFERIARKLPRETEL